MLLANFLIDDYVVQKGSTSPLGIVEAIHGQHITVRWGTSDRKTFRDIFRYDQLEKVPYKVYSPDEVIKRQADEAGGKLKEELSE